MTVDSCRVGNVARIIGDPDPHQRWIVIGYRSEDDTVVVTDPLGDRIMRWDAANPTWVVEHAWDTSAAQGFHTTLRSHLLDHVGRPSQSVALMVSDQLDHTGERMPL
jgi:hypothetical protein